MRVEELRLLQVDATQGGLVPHVAGTFVNSLAFHEQLWGWDPSEPVTVVLLDLTDRGSASAGVVPRKLLILDIAPLSFVYEIIAASERMNRLMNHELVHIVATDPATGESRVFLKDARIGDLAFNRADGAIPGVRDFNGFATLVWTPQPLLGPGFVAFSHAHARG
jgi:hypothetical protein